MGYRPENTIGLTSLKPARGVSQERCSKVTVSPTRGIGHILDTGDHEADLARRKLRSFHHLRGKDTDFEHFEGTFGGHEQHLVPLFQRTVEQAHQNDNPLILGRTMNRTAAPGSGAVASPTGGGILETICSRISWVPDALLGAGPDRVVGADTDNILDLLNNPVRVGGG